MLSNTEVWGGDKVENKRRYDCELDVSRVGSASYKVRLRPAGAFIRQISWGRKIATVVGVAAFRN